MHWLKRGLIYQPTSVDNWQYNSALQPTPFLRDDGIIRVFCGFRDKNGVSRVGFVDLHGDNPSEVLKVSAVPSLDIGLPGAFDDNGVVPCAVIKRDNKLYLYYAGYQLQHKVRFHVFSGLAISEDGGETFKRFRNTPLLERTNEEFLFRVIHSIIFERGVWKVWYGAGNQFLTTANKTVPVYDIRYMESSDGINFPTKGNVAINLQGDEYRVGRPYVIKSDHGYEMFFAAATQEVPYRLSYAYSSNGEDWTRNDSVINLTYEPNDFDSQMNSYPAVVKYQDKTYLFYNGNNYGENGFGYAELICD